MSARGLTVPITDMMLPLNCHSPAGGTAPGPFSRQNHRSLRLWNADFRRLRGQGEQTGHCLGQILPPRHHTGVSMSLSGAVHWRTWRSGVVGWMTHGTMVEPGMPNHPAILSVSLLFKTGFHTVAQASLGLCSPGWPGIHGPSVLASARITVVPHHTQWT